MAAGFFSPLAFWVGGAGSPLAPPQTRAGIRSMAAFWMGGAEAPGSGPPPPPSSGVFTVSGGWVSLTFAEFFSDVVFTDAPVCKRTN